MKKPAQLVFKGVSGHGGFREGAGRKRFKTSTDHRRRNDVSAQTPIGITMKILPGLVNLRCGEVEVKFQEALEVAQKFGLRVIHYSLQSNHIHMIAEVDGPGALARGMRSLGARLGKSIRKLSGGAGPVFKERFHLHPLDTPTEMKRALAYVLLNSAKHLNCVPYVDSYSSGRFFGEWHQLLGRNIGLILRSGRDPVLARPSWLAEPRSWLATEGWRKSPVECAVGLVRNEKKSGSRYRSVITHIQSSQITT